MSRTVLVAVLVLPAARPAPAAEPDPGEKWRNRLPFGGRTDIVVCLPAPPSHRQPEDRR
jgi:hypothetical protein